MNKNSTQKNRYSNSFSSTVRKTIKRVTDLYDSEKTTINYVLQLLSSHFIPYNPYGKIQKINNIYQIIKYLVKEKLLLREYEGLFNDDNTDNLKLLMQMFKFENNNNLVLKNIILTLPNGENVEYKYDNDIFLNDLDKFIKSSILYDKIRLYIDLDNLSSYDKNLSLLILFLNKLFLHITYDMKFTKKYDDNIALNKYRDYLRKEYNTFIFNELSIDKLYKEPKSYKKFIYLYQLNLLLKLYELYPEYQNIKRYTQGYTLPLFLYRENDNDNTNDMSYSGGGFQTNTKFLYLLQKAKDSSGSENDNIINLSNVLSLVNYSSSVEMSFYSFSLKEEFKHLYFISDKSLKKNLKDYIINFLFRADEKNREYQSQFNEPLNIKDKKTVNNKTYNTAMKIKFIIEHNGKDKEYQFINIDTNICKSILNLVICLVKKLYELNKSYSEKIYKGISESTMDIEVINSYKKFFNIYHKIYNNNYEFKKQNNKELINFVSLYISLIEGNITNENNILQILYLVLSKFIINNRINEIINKNTIKLL